MTIEILLILVCAALVLSVFSVFRCYVPPQTRQVIDLAANVADLQTGVDALASRLTKRSKVENMETARDTLETKRARRDAIEEHALKVLENAKAQPQPQPQDEESMRIALRRQVLFPSTTKQ